MNNIYFPKVSVGILTYNSTQYLPKSLDRILAQDYKNIEIIILDDCSQDDSFMQCVEYAKNHSNIQVMKNAFNLGVYGALNVLLEKCSGEYFFWAALDDDWSDNFISDCIASIQKSKASAAMGIVKNIWDVSTVPLTEYIYTDLNSKFNHWKLIKSIISAKDFLGNPISYNQFIHGVVNSKIAKKLFTVDEDIWIHEELLVCAMANMEGLCFAKNAYHINLHSIIPLSVRHPKFAKRKFSKKNYFLGLFKFVFLVIKFREVSFIRKIELVAAIGLVLKNRFLVNMMKYKIALYENLKKWGLLGEKNASSM